MFFMHETDVVTAERLCDRVVAMCGGRVIDSGTPSELVNRHGQAATITFTAPTGHIFDVEPDRLEGLPGVREVWELAGRITIRGDRRAIAHVSAALVGAGWVPPDLSVHVPGLEDALVDLLERADAPAASDLVDPDPNGARR